MRKFFLDLKVKNKILFLYGFNLLFSIILILIISIFSGQQIVKYFALSESELNSRILNLLLDEQNNKLNELTSFLSKNNALKNAIINNDYKTLNNDISLKSKNDSVDILIVFNKKGEIIADQNNFNRVGDKFSSLNNLVQSSIEKNKQYKSFEVIGKNDLIKESLNLYEKAKLQRKPTDGSKKDFITKKLEEDALVNLVITPIQSTGNKEPIGAILAASVLNKQFDLIEKAKNKNKGTAITIFKDDLRIATTVLNKQGKRAVGTLLSAKVVDKVLIEGNDYKDIAMVVGKPYWSYYKPIKNVDKKVIGALFTAVSEDYIYSIVKEKFGINLFLGLFAIILITIPITFFVATRITKPIENLTAISKKLEQNDFTVVIENNNNKDEIGELYRTFKNFLNHLKNMMASVGEAAQNVNKATNELTGATEQTAQGAQQASISTAQLAQGAQEISRNVEDGASNINKMNKIIQGVSEEAKIVAQLGNDTETNANTGAEHVNKAVSKINSIKQVAGDISVNISELGQLSSEIEQIVDLIKNIAGQTNLLALNAAIEAARAGEHGKGFAVVADEVKKLAGQSANATEKITAMIKEIQNKTQIAVTTMNKATNEVEEGVLVINDAGKALDNIIIQAKAANNKIQGISKEIDGVARNSEEIVQMIENISAITEETAASAEEISSITEEQTASLEEISASSQTLAGVAENLTKQMSVFKI